MQKIEIKYRPGLRGDNIVRIDGVDFSHMTAGVSVRMEAGDVPTIRLNLIPRAIEISTDGVVEFDHIQMTDELQRALYRYLDAARQISVDQMSIALAKLYNGTVPGDDMWCELNYEALEYALGHPVERKPLQGQDGGE